ncbi:MAG: nucleotidyl transferase AbiEii/AbiGii toxin family protein [Kiritimatiellia bacterium]
MNEAIRQMLDRYACKTRDDYLNALREIMQELALLGLWRSKFFEHAAFYGGTALRVLHGLDRYSEDLDFSLLKPDARFTLARYGDALRHELRGFGFSVQFTQKTAVRKTTAIESAFLKTDTVQQLIVLEAAPEIVSALPRGRQLIIKLEVDADPPPAFITETKYVLQPVPFAVRVYSLPDLFAGKMHAVLCRKWKNRVKGRDWYDLVWYAGRHPELRLRHLEARMRQSGDYTAAGPLTPDDLRLRLAAAIARLDVRQAFADIEPFVRDRQSLTLWSKEFFTEISRRIVPLTE